MIQTSCLKLNWSRQVKLESTQVFTQFWRLVVDYTVQYAKLLRSSYSNYHYEPHLQRKLSQPSLHVQNAKGEGPGGQQQHVVAVAAAATAPPRAGVLAAAAAA